MSGTVIPFAPVVQAEVQQLDDFHMAPRIADDALAGRYVWAKGLGWMRYDGRRWETTSDESVAETIRKALIAFQLAESEAGADADRLRKIAGLFYAHRLRAITGIARGLCEVKADEFDRHPDLLNVGNGVYDFIADELIPHDPALLLTKVTKVNYDPAAIHEDWETAIGVLPEAVADWMQVRFGQAATGHPTADDRLPVMQGGGANGKSTMLTPIMAAMGDHAVGVPSRVLLANNNDHPTTLMSLRGARIAVMEETEESGRLSVKRLKDVLGTDPMTARYIAQNDVSWSPTHSIFLSTNYIPQIAETDNGSWRRLTLVRHPYTFRQSSEALVGNLDRLGDPRLRDRLKAGTGGRHEAVLAWIVEGARQWYAEHRVMPQPPATVTSDTRMWRKESDLIMSFVEEHLVLDPNSHARRTDVYAEFSDWLASNGHSRWTEKTFASRFGQHELVTGAGVRDDRVRLSAPGLSHRPELIAGQIPERFRAWMGVRFRLPTDDD